MNNAQIMFCYFCALMATMILLGSQPCFAQNSEGSDSEVIQLLNPWWAEALQASRRIQAGQASAAIKAGELDAAQAAYYPTLRASTEGGPSKTKLWNEKGPVTPESKTEWNAQVGLNASLNLYNGVTQLRVAAAKNGVQAGNLELESTQASLATGMARELVTIWRQWRSLVESESLLAQAQVLQKIAQRKQKSGFLGTKELLEADRETVRSQSERNAATASLENRIALFNSRYRLASTPLQVTQLAAFEKLLEQLAERSRTLAAENAPAQQLENRSLDLRRSQLELATSEIQQTIARRERFGLSLDALAGVSNRFLDTVNTPEAARALAPERNLNLYAQLSLSVNVFAPQASATAEVARLRTQQAVVLEAQQKDDIALFLLNIKQQWPILMESQEFNSKLVTMSEDLRSKNTRLFEAGEIDTFLVIAGQKELALQKQALSAAQARIYDLALRQSAAFELGLVLSGDTPDTVGNIIP